MSSVDTHVSYPRAERAGHRVSSGSRKKRCGYGLDRCYCGLTFKQIAAYGYPECAGKGKA